MPLNSEENKNTHSTISKIKRHNMNIFIICGFSASGKDSILNTLLKTQPNLLPIISHTSRPIRKNETNGKDYNFVSKEEFIGLINEEQMVEYRAYNTTVDNKPDTWFYGVSKKAINTQHDNIAVMDISGAIAMKKIYGNIVEVIFVSVNDEVRMQRAVKRGSFDLTEWNRRLLHDCEILKSEEIAVCDHFIKNDNLDEAVQEVAKIINKR